MISHYIKETPTKAVHKTPVPIVTQE